MSGCEKGCLIRGDGGQTIRATPNRISINATPNRISIKWTLLVIATMHERRLRFGGLQQHTPGISQRMLTLTFKDLQSDGLVTRTAYGEVAPRVE